jgi:hypothetical protein
MRRWFIAAMIGSAVASADGCRGGSQARRLQSSRDSAMYETKLSRWRHDSLVIDSLGRLVPMDSMYRLYHAMLAAPRPIDYVPMVICLTGELVWRYGSRPYSAGRKRMNDTLWKKGEEVAARAMEERTSKHETITIDNEKCGSLRRSDHASDSVDGVSLELEMPRPAPPKRPWLYELMDEHQTTRYDSPPPSPTHSTAHMAKDRKNPNIDHELVRASDEGRARVVAPDPAAITRDDLVRVFRTLYPDNAAELIADLEPEIGRLGEAWSSDILLAVAQLSPEHEIRIRDYLGWSPERMASEIAKVRSQ